ncbi:MAG: glycosyltransferase [Chlamydiae bacterium]|nr:glycosyltransferase [Chlamydiota bacterium]
MTQPIILLCSQFHRLGGLEKYGKKIAETFCNKQFSVTLLTSRAEKRSSLPLQEIHYKMKSPLSFLKVYEFDRFCQNYIKKNPHSLVYGLDRNRFQTHLRAGNGVHAAYLKERMVREGKLYALRHFLNPLHQMILHIEKQAFEHPDLQRIYANSNMVKEEILHFYRVDPKKIRVIHNGVEWKEMEKDFLVWQNQKILSQKKYGLSSSSFHFLFIGNNFKRKGLKELLFAFAKMKEGNWQLSIVGKDKDLNHYVALTENLHLAKKVHFFGEVKNPYPFYQLADCLAIPSYYDPFANVTLEALAMGLFVISSKKNGGHEILSSENGATLESLEIEPLAHALRVAMNQPKTWENSMKIRDSVKHLDFSIQLEKLCAL